MSDEIRWTFDRDPPPDTALARLLRRGGASVPSAAVDWERLCQEIMRRAAVEDAGSRNWWELVVQWGGVAAAASVAAMLLSGFLLWRVISGPLEREVMGITPESIAIARAASAYPDETAFASLVRTEHSDEFTTWGTR
jgi:hypothetical protein